MSRARHELAVRNSLAGINTGLTRGYTETLHFPDFDLGGGADFYIEVDPDLKAEVIAIGLYNVTEVVDDDADGDGTIAFGDGSDADEFLVAFDAAEGALAEIAANTNDATDADAARDLTRYIKIGDDHVIPASQLITATGTAPTGNDGTFDLYVTLRYFE